MRNFVLMMQRVWRVMFEPPWKKSAEYSRWVRWEGWTVGWFYALEGLVAGALVAPSLLDKVGLANSPYYDWLLITIPVVTSVLVQLLWWGSMVIMNSLWPSVAIKLPWWKRWLLLYSYSLVQFVAMYLGFVLVYNLISALQTKQGGVAISLVGGLVFNLIIIPFIVGKLGSRFVDWIRDKDQEAAPPQ